MAEKEYIERENYCENICRCPQDLCDKTQFPIRNAPAADVVEVRHGEWKKCGSKAPDYSRCSCCNTVFGVIVDDYKYCPHCGAKMDGE